MYLDIATLFAPVSELKAAWYRPLTHSVSRRRQSERQLPQDAMQVKELVVALRARAECCC